MTLNEIAYNIKNLVEGGRAGEDSNLSIRQIRHMIHYYRAQLLQKYTDSGRYMSNSMFQTISQTVGTGIWTIPALVGFSNNRALKEIYLVKNTGIIGENKKLNLPVINDCDREFFEESRFAPNKNQFFVTYGGNTITVYDNDGQIVNDSTHDIYITAVFENPSLVPDYSGADGRYPMPSELIASLVENILAKEFNMYLRTSADIANNSVDDKGANPAATPVSASPNANARSRRGRAR